jgi:phasin
MSNQPIYEIPSEMREFAEKSVDQARKAFDGFMGAAQKAAEQVQGTAETARASATDASAKVMAQAEANVTAAFDHAQKLVRAKDLSEVMALQTDFVKAQMASFQNQMKELGSAVQKAAATAASAAPKGK